LFKKQICKFSKQKGKHSSFKEKSSLLIISFEIQVKSTELISVIIMMQGMRD
jgi:hypothetical protein